MYIVAFGSLAALQANISSMSAFGGLPGGSVEIELGEENTPVLWDGRNQAGEPVANGEYLIEVQIIDGDQEAIFTETVTVLHGAV